MKYHYNYNNNNSSRAQYNFLELKKVTATWFVKCFTLHVLK